MAADPNKVLEHLSALRQLTGDDMGAQRVAWTPGWLQARTSFEALIDALPHQDRMERHYDAAGNHWITLRGESERALLIGSHLDSVPNGGWLDGCLGVLAGLEILRSLSEQYAGRPPLTIRLVDFADEEGARFGRSVLGSSAFAGTHSIAADRVRTDKDGVSLEAALAACGVAVEDLGQAEVERRHAQAYLELHIEQGPVLEEQGLPLAVVTGTKGV
jgi:N-carbamoyl-L-amino-acid hydrolase